MSQKWIYLNLFSIQINSFYSLKKKKFFLDFSIFFWLIFDSFSIHMSQKNILLNHFLIQINSSFEKRFILIHVSQKNSFVTQTPQKWINLNQKKIQINSFSIHSIVWVKKWLKTILFNVFEYIKYLDCNGLKCRRYDLLWYNSHQRLYTLHMSDGIIISIRR